MESLPRDALASILTHVSAREYVTLSMTCTALRLVFQEDALWQALAVAKWGPCVDTLAARRLLPGQWRNFCCHRLCFRPSSSPSPLDLVQEQFLDPWTHIACCLLCSRTSGSACIHNALHSFLLQWPTPSALLTAPEPDLLAALRPLGLQVQRLEALRNMSRDFLATDWEDPSEFKGCGKFVSDSWKIFCRGLRDPKHVTDVNLSRYLHWRLGGQETSSKRKGKAAAPKRKRGDEELAGQSRSSEAGCMRRQTRSMAPGKGVVGTRQCGSSRKVKSG